VRFQNSIRTGFSKNMPHSRGGRRGRNIGTGYLFIVLANLVLAWLERVTRIGLLQGVFAFAAVLPSISMPVRRLHDTNRNGWWALVLLCPPILAVGGYVILMLGSLLIDVDFCLVLLVPIGVVLSFSIGSGVSSANAFGPDAARGHVSV
jgi:uncharacterized membrane protein YhaH (DUF805 family)